MISIVSRAPLSQIFNEKIHHKQTYGTLHAEPYAHCDGALVKSGQPLGLPCFAYYGGDALALGLGLVADARVEQVKRCEEGDQRDHSDDAGWERYGEEVRVG